MKAVMAIASANTVSSYSDDHSNSNSNDDDNIHHRMSIAILEIEHCSGAASLQLLLPFSKEITTVKGIFRVKCTARHSSGNNANKTVTNLAKAIAVNEGRSER